MITEPVRIQEQSPTGACVFERAWHATPNNVSRSRAALLACLREHESDEATLAGVAAAVSEVTTNAVFHAYVGQRVGQFQVTAGVLADHITVSVADEGCGFAPDAPKLGGRRRVDAIADRVETRSSPGRGTVTTMWFARSR